VLFRGIEVGQVISSTFDGADKGFTVRVFVQKPYDQLNRVVTELAQVLHDGAGRRASLS
jgi:paraquat-inducible protein B